MPKQTFDPKLPAGFNYSVKNGEMILNFYCDCCNKEVKVSKIIEGKQDHYQSIFDSLKHDMDGSFYRCNDCGFLICEDCWNKREQKCKNCPICVLAH
ncbi:MAG: hypothetical protein FK734_07150 [Asgard group archaeon]|nr:hypothetical protein [Asgard group archaeon]